MPRALAFLLLIPLTAGPAGAQTQTGYAFEAGAITAYSDAAIQIGLRIGPVRPSIGSVDFAAATFPDAIAEGIYLFMFDVDATYGAPLAGDQVVLFPRAGLSVIGGSGSSGGGGGGAVGYNVGIGVFGRASPKLGLRLDYTRRRFVSGGSESLPLSSITAGIVLIH